MKSAMATRTTKWNYLRNALPHETVDPTRKGHKKLPLVLNPFQFSELARLAEAEEGSSSGRDNHAVRKDARKIHRMRREDHKEEGRNVERRKIESIVSGQVDHVKRSDKTKAEKEVRPEDSVSQCEGRDSDSRSQSYASSSSPAKQHHPKPTSSKEEPDKTKPPAERDTNQRERKASPRRDAGDSMGRSAQTKNQARKGDVDSWSDDPSSKVVVSSDSNTLEHYNFPGLEHTPQMKQLMALRGQLHAMKLQTKKQAEDQAIRCHRSYRHPETIPDNPHYDRWEPKILYEDSSNKELYRKWRKLRRENEKKRRNREPVRSITPELKNDEVVDNDGSVVSKCSLNSPVQDTYSKAIFQRGGEFEPEKIRKRYVFSKTHWLKGDGFEAPERDNWVRKPDPEYITMKTVDSDDPRFRRVKSASLVSLTETPRSRSSHCSLSSLNADRSNTASPKPLSLKSHASSEQNLPREPEKPLEKQPRPKQRSKSAVPVQAEVKREELPHQRHHDFRRLKEIFSAPRPEYDRLARDRETLTQYEKEMRILRKSQKEADRDKMVEAAEKQLEIKKEVTPEERSAAMLKQVRKGRVQQLEDKASALRHRLLQDEQWDRRMMVQQRQHLQRLQQKHEQKQEAQKKMRRALTKLMAERRARERAERNAQERERIEREQQQLQHEQHERALKKQMAAEKHATLHRLQQDLRAAQQRHDKCDLQYGVARRREYRDRKRRMQRGAPAPPLPPPSPRHFTREAAAMAKNAPVFQTVDGR